MRVYYKHRLFMGFCCVCVEVLYLSVRARPAALLNSNLIEMCLESQPWMHK